ncbi:undecaprenyldiphospho-muramoylpentapeptide beta-N-acetylglucosaminyltransferase [Enterobacteriaceae endosymbiont of Donacia bicoloricornis]|uniref:undecaprenyldiphospho-muramoylpentapeptide beta-N-acetylglucosaminyltransferase n=1 Tax=Enterobacteriaceae endosymbiont of Donacia bicoloricornis TaxID=2675772 RepID=UPI0014494EC6|nr:undecaprenyldiphospho-muramoylpentapeptide beta-N-acetylglucosaminyltransferase [Enterobacteriaceae endosymbiont of Donacia bicoloricornis]QJC37677.1 undecaprenyldiphospho-muramoylpentapeptide beta-N-acetylglucosaminyltransferase [Enterobacteriaceae endosymbiont of Donacia bicoloricornis]
MKKKKKIIIVAGGTGGHINPALNIAYKLIKKGWEVRWLGTPSRMEAEIIPKKNIRIYLIKFSRFKNKNIFSIIITILKLIISTYKTILIYKKYKPHLVLTMGSYISGPSGLAAWLCNIPLIIHEQNSISGITNKILSKIATIKMQAYPNTLHNAVLVGNPISNKIIKLSLYKRSFIKIHKPIHLLITGGSQGADLINKIGIKLSKILKNKISILHQVGKGNFKKIYYEYKKNKIYNLTIKEHIENIDKAYKWADIILCRSGAMTVAEITTIGLPAIFIPFEHKDKQQYFNAIKLKKIGIAKIYEKHNLDINKIANIILTLNKKKIAYIAKRSYNLVRKNSIELIYQELKKIKIN